MTAFDPHKYSSEATPKTSHTGLSASPKSQQNSPVSFVIMGVAGVVIMASAGSAIPGLKDQFQTNQVVQSRLAANGLSLIEGKELSDAIKISQPIVSEDNPKELALIGWEEIITNKKFPPGTYLTQNSIVIKAVNGSKSKLDPGTVTGHRVGTISPELAQKRLVEFRFNLKKIGDKNGQN